MIFGLALLVVALVLWRFLPRERRLMERARRVCSLSNPEVDRQIILPFPGEHLQLPYFWLSDHDLISFGATPPTRFSVPYGYDAWHIDARTGVYTRLPQLDRTLQKLPIHSGPIWGLVDRPDAEAPYRQTLRVWMDGRVSPDGKWILSADGNITAFTLDGARSIRFPDTALIPAGLPGIEDQVAWLPDSRGWVYMPTRLGNPRTMQVRIYDLSRPGIYHVVRVPTPGVSKLLGCTRKGDVLAWVRIPINLNSDSHFNLNTDPHPK
jgi:hypothetical protein